MWGLEGGSVHTGGHCSGEGGGGGVVGLGGFPGGGGACAIIGLCVDLRMFCLLVFPFSLLFSFFSSFFSPFSRSACAVPCPLGLALLGGQCREPRALTPSSFLSFSPLLAPSRSLVFLFCLVAMFCGCALLRGPLSSSCCALLRVAARCCAFLTRCTSVFVSGSSGNLEKSR